MDRFLRPERFDGDPTLSSTAMEWEHWKQTFENFLAAREVSSASISKNDDPRSNVQLLSDAVKLQLLVNFISPRVFAYVCDCKTYTDALTILNALYIKPRNVIYARHVLATRRQQFGESIDTYLQALKQLSKECQFTAVNAETNKSEHIRGAFIAGIISSDIRQRLLENLTLSLDQAYNLALSMETAETNSALFKTQSPMVNAISHPSTLVECTSPITPVSSVETVAAIPKSTETKNYSKRKCFFCGGSVHARKSCPALDVECHACGKKGHYSTVCRSKSQIQNSAACDKEECKYCTACITAAAPPSLQKAMVTAFIKGVRADALIDTGSSVSFINERFVNLLNLRKQNCQQTVSMASVSLKSQVKDLTRQTIHIGKYSYENIELLIVKDLCADIIIGHDVLQLHSTLELAFGGPKQALKICSVAEATVPAVPLFTNLATECKPIAIRSRKHSHEDTVFIDAEVKKLLQEGIIEESQSPWRAQVLITNNANHKKRMVIDYSQTINRYTQLDAYPLPNIEEIVTQISNYAIFSTIDLQSAYHQVPILPQEKKYTAFEAAKNLYQFTRVPFGVTNGVSAFQRTIDWVIRKEELSGTFAYIDDITVCGKTQKDHDINLEKFMLAVNKYGLTLNKEKSKFNLKSIKILGYSIDNHVIRPDNDRLKPLLDLSPPNDVASLRRTLGMFAHYSKWIPNFSEKIHPLVHSPQFPLNNEALNAFENLKSMIAKSTVNAIDNNISFTVETDASEHSIAATLSQNSRPVAFYSRTLNRCEQNHSAIEKEAYAIVESLKKWRHFLIGKPFKLITDQRSVSFMFNSKLPSKIKNEKIQRWRLELAPFNYDIIYRPGRENHVADALSRISASMNSQSRSLKLKELHDHLCHPGVTRMHHWLKNKNLAYTIDEVRVITNNCRTCAEVKPRFYRHPDPPPELIKATSPFERISIDFKGPVPTSTKNRFILTVIDEYSRFPFAFPCSDVSAKTVITHLNSLFMLFGMPCYVHSDRGASFMSSEVKQYLHSRGIATSRTTAYNPQGNGQVEKLNSTLWKTIQLALKTHNLPIEQWQKVLPFALHSIRSLLCTTINCTPHERMFRHSRRSPSGTSMPTWLSEAGQVLLRRCDRSSKYQPLVEEVDLLESNADYSFVRLPDGRETTVSNRHLAPIGGQGEIIASRPEPEVVGNPEPQDLTEQLQPDMDLESTTLRRSVRTRRSPQYLGDYSCN